MVLSIITVTTGNLFKLVHPRSYHSPTGADIQWWPPKADGTHSTGMLSRFTDIFTARKLSLRRLRFPRCLSVHGGGVCPIACCDTPRPPRPEADPTADTPPAQCMLGYSQQAGGRHPTGMHSCCCRVSQIFLIMHEDN